MSASGTQQKTLKFNIADLLDKVSGKDEQMTELRAVLQDTQEAKTTMDYLVECVQSDKEIATN